MISDFFIDLHCHSSLKPYCRSFPENKNSSKPEEETSIWHSDKPTVWDKIKNIFLTITQFTQTDFTTLLKSNVRIIGASISPIEKGFFVSRIGDGRAVDSLANIVTGIGKKKVNFIQQNLNYFSECLNEYNFLLQLNKQIVNINGVSCKYILINNFNQIEENITDENTLLVVPTIEGTHALCSNNNRRYEEEEIIANIQELKQLDFPPLFISLTHHFYNEIAGHAYSLSSKLQKLINQDFGANTQITGLGNNVIKELLDNSASKRILIDIKHMSRLSRREYYSLLKSPEYSNQTIPIIVSHGAINGRKTVYSNDEDATDNGLFYGGDINFYDDEIVLITESKGIFGLQLDEKRSVGKNLLKKTQFRLFQKKMLEAQSRLLWNQIEHIANVLDNVGQNSWDNICIGSDFDGVSNPLNGFWTAKEYPLLAHYLQNHAHDYLNSSRNTLSDKNKYIKSKVVVEKIFKINALNFLRRNL